MNRQIMLFLLYVTYFVLQVLVPKGGRRGGHICFGCNLASWRQIQTKTLITSQMITSCCSFNRLSICCNKTTTIANKEEGDEETLVLFTLTCDVCSPSPYHVCMAYHFLDKCCLKLKKIHKLGHFMKCYDFHRSHPSWTIHLEFFKYFCTQSWTQLGEIFIQLRNPQTCISNTHNWVRKVRKHFNLIFSCASL